MRSPSESLHTDTILVYMPDLPPAADGITANATSTCVTVAWTTYDPFQK